MIQPFDYTPPTLMQLLESFGEEIERRAARLANPNPGGQQVSDFGDFCSASPSVVGRLRWWHCALTEAAQREISDKK